MHKTRLIGSLVIGLIADGLLRIQSGDEGNLLVHMVVFLVSSGITYGSVSIYQKYMARRQSQNSYGR